MSFILHLCNESCILDIQFLSVKNKLKDGVKIVVFSATIVMDQDTPLMKLSINSTKLASNSAPLGYCKPTKLLRGLSLKHVEIGSRQLDLEF